MGTLEVGRDVDWNARLDENVSSTLERIADSQLLSRFGRRNGSVHSKTVEMIESPRVGPLWQVRLAQLHECLLEVRDGLAALGIARRDDTALAGIVARKIHRANAKGLEFIRLAK